jgi:hypothetical protein
MSSEGSVSHWISELKAGDPAAAQTLWERFFRRVVGLARKKLQGPPPWFRSSWRAGPWANATTRHARVNQIDFNHRRPRTLADAVKTIDDSANLV